MASEQERKSWSSKLILPIVAAFLLVPAFIPFGALDGYTDELRSGFSIVKQWILGLLIVGVLSVVLPSLLSSRFLELPAKLLERLVAVPSVVFVPIILSILFTALTAISHVVFRARPMNIDAIVQLFQAKSFAKGELFAPPPQHPEFFITLNNLFEPNGWYSQYPPGHMAIMAIGVLIGMPWLVMVLCSVLTALFLYLFAREAYDDKTAKLCLLLLLVTPFFLFMGASHMNHVSTALFVVMALYFYARWENAAKDYWLCLCGASLGVAFLSRPLCALMSGVVIGSFFLGRFIPKRSYAGAIPPVIWGIMGFLPFGIILFIYNYLTTGDPFLPGYLKLWGEGHGLGFHETPFGKVHSVLKGLQNETFDISLLSEYLFEWPIPSLFPIALAVLLGAFNKRWDRRLLLLFFAYPAVYFFYWHRDTFLGPRFLYLSVLPAVPLTVRSIICLLSRFQDGSIRVFPSQPPVSIVRVIIVGVTLCFFYSATLGFPFRFQIYNNGLNSLKGDILQEARDQGIKSGLIFVPVVWGSRIIAKLRALGVSAHTVEKTYRSSDHCELDRVSKEFWGRNTPPAEVEAAVIKLRGEAVQKYKLNGDPTLRLSANRKPTSECWDEINYDAQGYHLFMPYLADNTPDLRGPFVIATDLRELNSKLIAEYPDLPVYMYRKGSFDPIQR